VNTLAAVEMVLTSATLSAAVATLGPYQSSQVSLPKFSFTTQLSLPTILQGMGITDAFDVTKADFSGMDGSRDLFLSTVEHQATVEVDESGTIAAAATAGGTQSGFLAESTVITIDQPFIFAIRDTKNGSVLFLGRVEDPLQGQ
jgi:serpin B